MKKLSVSGGHMSFKLKELPFHPGDLTPYLSEKIIEYHYEKHHRRYVEKLNQLIIGTDFANENQLEKIIKNSSGKIFVNAAQIWNHDFFWNCITPPKNSTAPSSYLAKWIEGSFGSIENFKNQCNTMIEDIVGSGWLWVIFDGQSLKLRIGPNAENPVYWGEHAVFTIDAWEHAYWLDYIEKDKPKQAFMESIWNIVNWDFFENRIQSM